MMKLWIKRLGWICLAPISVVLLLSILLYIPPFQRFTVGLATDYIGEATGMQIHIDKIRLSFPLNLTVKGVEIIQEPSDTLLNLKSLTVQIKALPLLKKQVLVEGIDIQDAKFDSGAWIEGLKVKGILGKLSAHADHIDLSDETATLNKILLTNSTITLLLNDSTEEEIDTTSTPVNWIFDLEKIDLKHVAFALQMPQDSLRLLSYINNGQIRDGQVDLGKSQYKVDHLQITNSLLTYDGDYHAPSKGLDYAHLYMSPLNASVDSIFYRGKTMTAAIRDFSLRDRSGLEISSTSGTLLSNEEQIEIPNLQIKTPHSFLTLQAEVPWTSIDNKPQKKLRANVKGSLGKEDLLLAAGPFPEDFQKEFPDKPIDLTAELSGNLARLRLTDCSLQLPGALDLDIQGDLNSVLNEKRQNGHLQIEAVTDSLNFLLSILPASQRARFNIPRGVTLTGVVSMTQDQFQTDFLLHEGAGKVEFLANLDRKEEAYSAHIRVDSLEPIHFMPKDSLLWVTAHIQAEGRGMDLFAAETKAKIQGELTNIRYGIASVSDIKLQGKLDNHRLTMGLKSHYPLAKMDIDLDATLKKNDVKAMFIADVTHADLQGLHFVSHPLATSFQIFAEAESDLNEVNKLDVTLGNWDITTQKRHYKPKTLTLRAQTDKDTTRVSFHAGDLGVVLTGNDCIHHISDQLSNVMTNVSEQLKQDSTVNLQTLRPYLPKMALRIQAGKDNPVYNYLEDYYTDFTGFNLNAYTSPQTGLRMDAAIYDLARDTMQIDTIRAEIYQDTLGLQYNAAVIKKKYRRQSPFSAGIYGVIQYGFSNANLYFKDGAGRTGLSLEIQATKIPDGFKLHLLPYEPTIAFRPFKLNKDNYITIRSLKDIEADLRFSGKNNAYIWVHSQDEGDKFKETHVELGQMDLDVVSKAFDYLPPMKGLLNADLKYAPTDSSFLMAADMNIDHLIYEDESVGNLILNTVYLPLGENDHQLDIHLFRDLNEISAVSAFYQSGENDHIDGIMDFYQFPLDIANPFIPEDMAKMKGCMNGSVTLNGSSSNPKANGLLTLDSASVYIGAVSSAFRFDPKPVEIKDNQLLFDKYGIYAFNKNPFVINGKIDFSDINKMTADLTLSANNLQLLNAKKTDISLAYGKLFVNLDSYVKGPLNNLTMRGDLQLLGNTNFSYVLKDSPLAVQDRMSGLVSFTSFADTLRRRMPKKPPLPVGGLDMLMTIRIDPAVQMNMDLSADESNRINLEGGGDLSFQYTPQGDMFLNGRYTLSGGMIKYSVPVIPLKEFNIQEGSFVQWTGDPMDPTLNLKATERIRTSVTPIGQSSPRLVNFDVGISLTQRLEDLGLQFTLEAPEDLAMQEELMAKGVEEQSKLAVSMLVTGMYLGGSGDNGKVNMNMGNALSSFLQSEINNIAGSALKTIDISFGMDTYDNAGDVGGSRTDYSFRFAKRFYNDRIRIILGGRISTGDKINNSQTQTFIDNVSIEYRLDNTGSRYVKLFHDKNYESLLEGEITETGGGIVLRKKMMKLRELFNFKKPKVKPVKEEQNEK